MYQSLNDLREALEAKGLLTKTQLRYTQKAYSLNSATIAKIFGIKLNSFNALKSYSTGSGNYSVANLEAIRAYIKATVTSSFSKELGEHGMLLTYTKESWDNRIRSGLQFEHLDDFDTAILKFLRDKYTLLGEQPALISTKELSNMMLVPEAKIPQELVATDEYYKTLDGLDVFAKDEEFEDFKPLEQE